MYKYVTLGSTNPTGTYIDFGFKISKDDAYALRNLQEKLHDAVAARLPEAFTWLYPGAVRVRLSGDQAEATAAMGKEAMHERGLEVEAFVNEVLNQPEFLGLGQL